NHAGYSYAIPFFDGRQQLKQNLIFQLRTTPTYQPLHYHYVGPIGDQHPVFNSADYVQSGLYGGFDSFLDSGTYFNELLPFQLNHRYRNFAFKAEEIALNGWPTAGVGWGIGYINDYYDEAVLHYPQTYTFAFP